MAVAAEESDEGFENGKYYEPEDDNEGDLDSLARPRMVVELDEEEESDSESEIEDAFVTFLQEVQETIARGDSENHALDTVHLEINGLKFQGNHTLAECCTAVNRAVLLMVGLGDDRRENLAAIKKALLRWTPLTKKFLLGEHEMFETLLFFEEFCTEHPEWRPYFSVLLQLGYDQDIFTEELIFKWEEEKKDGDEDEQELLQLSAKFLTWLREADEEDDDDSNEESDES